jgi:hypothetical protein
MAGSIVVNGKTIFIPGIYFAPEYLKIQSRPPLSSTIAVVGEIPFLPQNTPYVSLTQADFDRLSPTSSLRKQLSSVLFDASDDAAVQNSPAAVYLVSPRTTTQAIGSLLDTNGDESIGLKAKQWGFEGNRTFFSIIENAVRGGWDVTIRNGTYIEKFNIQPEPALMTLNWDMGAGVVPQPTGYGTITLASSNGTVSTNYSITIDESDVSIGGATLSWDSYGPVDGPITVLPLPGGLIGAGKELTVSATGISRLTGLEVTVPITFTEAELEAVTPVAKPLGDWAGPVLVNIGELTAVTYNGELRFTGRVFPNMNAAAGQTYVADVISFISSYANKGFEVSTLSTRAATMKLVDLDDSSGTLPESLTATTWKLLTTINSRSLLVEATREGDLPPVTSSVVATSFFLAGGTETGATTNNWTAALEALEFLDVDVLVPLYDPSGVAAAADPIFPLFKAHLDLMWSNGANERFLWIGAGEDETLNELRARITSHGDDRIAICVDNTSLVSFNNTIEEVLPYWTAVQMAAMDASTTGLVNFTYRSPRVTGYRRNDTLYGRDAREALIENGLYFLVQDAGMPLPQVQRDVTSYTSDQDPRRTNRVAKRSLMTSCKRMRRALKPLLVAPDGSIPTRADVEGAVRQELDTQRASRVFASFDPGKVVVNEYADRIEVEYEIAVQIGKDFIVVRPKVSAPLTQSL